jgi:universal stress protein A
MADEPRLILAAIDLDELSAEALRKAAQSAKAHGSDLLVVHISSDTAPSAPIPLPGTSGLAEEAKKALLDQAEKKVRAMVDENVEGPTPTIEVHHHTSPADAICALAKERGADRIVVGAHQRSGLSRILLGSVAESVVRHAPCDVHVVRPEAE